MALITSQPGAHQTPDAVLGGLAVTGDTDTGHASTVTSGSGGSTQRKSCRWFTFQSVAEQILSVTLKIDHTSQGALSGPSPTNVFQLDYSLNNGGSWTNAVTRTDFTAAQGPTTFSAALSAAQDISQIQARVLYDANTLDLGDAASVTATIADIKVEVETVDARPIMIM